MFFAFGALLWGRTARDGELLIRRVGRGWPISLGIAVVVVFPLGTEALDENAEVGVAVAFQVVHAWLMIFGLMGLFRRVLGSERPAVRYLSDSSYWLYLAHLPLVIFLQGEVANVDLPGEVKLVGIVVVATVLLLISYAVFVRYTPIGWLLNGRRRRPSSLSRPFG